MSSYQAQATKINTAAGTLEKGVEISEKKAHREGRKVSLVKQANSTDNLRSLNINNYFDVKQKGKSTLKSQISRRISCAAVPTTSSVTEQKRRRATIHHL